MVYNYLMRKPIVDGIFYPAEKDKLEAAVKRLLADAPEPETGIAAPEAVLVPHAGYSYTGKLAAMGFKSAAGRDIQTAVILAPVTRDAQDGIFLCDFDAFGTPMGDVQVDKEAAAALLNNKGRFAINSFPFLEEHSIEVQLPFIQYLWPEARIVPIHMGRQNPGTVKQLSRALRDVFGPMMEKTLFVISANASPYLSRSLAQEYAEAFVSLVTEGDYDKILIQLQKRRPLPNGTGCAAAVLGMKDAKSEVRILGKSDSGGDKAVFYTSLSIQL